MQDYNAVFEAIEQWKSNGWSWNFFSHADGWRVELYNENFEIHQDAETFIEAVTAAVEEADDDSL